MGSSIWTIISSVIGNVLDGLNAFFGFLQLKKKKTESQDPQEHTSTPKRSYDKIIMIVVIILLFGFLIWQLVSNKKNEPLLVFTGGGSVRNYLMDSTKYGKESIIDIRNQPNSINIALASGSAWRVLAEEYHDRKLNKFTTICLSAGKMSKVFYDEYISFLDSSNRYKKPYLDEVIVAEVLLDDDTLVVYPSDAVKKMWNMEHTDAFQLDTLAYRLQRIIEGKEDIAVFTTNKLSGTLEQYKKSFQDLTTTKIQDSLTKIQDSLKELPDSIRISESTKIHDLITAKYYVDLEKMLDVKQAFAYYDKTDPDCIYTCYNTREYRPFIILGSAYYKVNEVCNKKGLYLLNGEDYITKPMFLYFLAYKENNVYKVNKRIMEFLYMLEERHKIHIEIEKQDEWKEMMRTKTIKYQTNTSNKMKKLVKLNYVIHQKTKTHD